MADVHVSTSAQTADGYRFEVLVDDGGRRSNHAVTLTNGDYERWSSQGMSPSRVAAECVEVLLRDTPRSQLGPEIDLHRVMPLYPGYEDDDR